MHRFARPPKPPTFDQDVQVQRDRIESLFKKGKLAHKKVKARAKKKKKEKDPFDNLWGDYKPAFSAAQYRKCGFCEGDAAVQQFGDVEHFCPKAAIHDLVNEGREQLNSPKVRGRTGPRVGRTGYWWLAYEWENYLLCCQICNRQWKANFFPVAEARDPDAPMWGGVETPLLLNPFRDPPPRDHLEYLSTGQVKDRAGSAIGNATIRTLGLNRSGLIEQRRDLADKIFHKLNALKQKSEDDSTRFELLRDIYIDGLDRRPFCGMVRAIVFQHAPFTWEELETLVGSSVAPVAPA